MEVITVKKYFDLLATGEAPDLVSATFGWGAVWDKDGKQLYNSDLIQVRKRIRNENV